MRWVPYHQGGTWRFLLFARFGKRDIFIEMNVVFMQTRLTKASLTSQPPSRIDMKYRRYPKTFSPPQKTTTRLNHFFNNGVQHLLCRLRKIHASASSARIFENLC